jgi:DNA-binding MarR family transcriptional regulator
MGHEDTTRELLNQVQTAAWQFTEASDAICSELGVTGAMREVLVRLASAGGKMTVPHAARLGGVSRQHVQALAARLRNRGLVTFEPNPVHARSPLMALTPKGRAVVETVRECEESLVSELASELPSDVATALAVLRRLNAAFHRRL